MHDHTKWTRAHSVYRATVSANVAGVLTSGSLASVDTWVFAGLHAVFPLTLYWMHRPAHALVTAERPAEHEG